MTQNEIERINDLFEEITEKNPYIKERLDGIIEGILKMKSRIIAQETDLEIAESKKDGLDCENSNLRRKLSYLSKQEPNSLEGQMKDNVCQRLIKNLSLEQLENIEQVVKNQFKGEKRNYILELF